MSIEKELITAIIVTHNNEEHIDSCLDSLIHYWPANLSKKIILVDNFSTDTTVIKIKKFVCKDVILLTQSENLGFARGVNIGILQSPKSDYYLLLNPDTEIEKNSILNMVSAIQEARAGICGGKTEGFQGQKQGDHFRKINLQIGLFDFTNLKKLSLDNYWHNYFYYLDSQFPSTSIQVSGVTGGFMLITQMTVKKNGLFDENFFMYLEDIDYCLRANKLGIKVVYTPFAKAKHYGGGSSKNKTRTNLKAWIQSRRYYFLKHFGLLPNIIIQPVFFIDSLLIFLMDKYKI